MKQIRKPSASIDAILSHSLPENGTLLVRSQFTYLFRSDKVTAVFHTLTKEILTIDNFTLPDQMIMSSETRENEDYIHLIKNNFYVRSTAYECELYCSVISALRALKNSSRGLLSTYTILPTTFCNARCFYCYELDYHFTAMSDETAYDLVDFIDQTHANKIIKLRWFGGEPLLGIRQIRIITEELKKRKIEFESSIITNGSLFNEQLITEAKNCWNLKSAQITVDGDESEYLKRKRYITENISSPYKTVIQNIRELLAQKIHVVIRLNIDFDNIRNIYRLIDDLDTFLARKEYIHLYAHPLFSVMASEDSSDLWKECFRIQEYGKEHGFNTYDYDDGLKLKTYYCMASNPSCAVIDPSGSIYGCEHCQNDSYLGNIKTGIKKRHQAVSTADVNKKCTICPFLPICTEFTSCPDIEFDCKQARVLMLNNALKSVIQSDVELPSIK